MKVDWKALREKILRQRSFIDEHGNKCKEVHLGKVSDLTPKRHHRNFGRHGRSLERTGSYHGYVKVSDIREAGEALRADSDWLRDLMAEAKKHGIYVRISDDSERIFVNAGINIDDEINIVE